MFDEEQMRLDQKGSWPGVISTMGAAHLHSTVQGIIRGIRTADKDSRISLEWGIRCADHIWFLDLCNFAMMSYTSGYGHVNAPGGRS